MNLAKGDMWGHYDPDTKSELWLFTANGRLKQGTDILVMGKGAAKQANDLVPGLDRHFGELLRMFAWPMKYAGLPADQAPVAFLYGLMIDPYWPTQNIGAFQTKLHWQHDSTIALIAFSTGQLWKWCQTHRNITINLNFPGIGLGGLHRDMVLPIIEWLPDNVVVWEYE